MGVGARSTERGSAGALRLLVCVAGIYTFFLTWGVLQERISTVAYVGAPGSPPGRFRFFIVLNMVQALSCVAVAAAVLAVQKRGLGPRDRGALREYARMAALACVSSPFGYAALRHVSFPILVLGKSCKLLPVMLMNWVVYRRRFERRKVLTVALITAGVAGFMFFEPRRAAAGASKSLLSALWGVALLLTNLLIDGTVNSLQDRVFMARPALSGQHMMFWMQLFSATFMAAYLVLAPWTTELRDAAAFVAAYPAVLPDMLLFGACGALGQVFVFYTLEHYGSLTLVAATVTRKLFTILLSLLYFKHALVPAQWASVALVFAALVLEAMAPKGARHGSAAEAKPLIATVDDAHKDAESGLLPPGALPLRTHADPNRSASRPRIHVR